MAINIKNPTVEQAVRTLASRLGVDLTEAIGQAVYHELDRLADAKASRLARMRSIANRLAELPVLDVRSDEEILAYDHRGMPS